MKLFVAVLFIVLLYSIVVPNAYACNPLCLGEASLPYCQRSMIISCYELFPHIWDPIIFTGFLHYGNIALPSCVQLPLRRGTMFLRVG